MRRIFQKELDMILHWNLTLVGGISWNLCDIAACRKFWFRTDRKCHGDGGGTYRKKNLQKWGYDFSISYF